jgi:arylsulfatase A-like enzyme
MWDVHYEYRPPPPYDTMFDPDYTGSVSGRSFMRDPSINGAMPARDLEHILALYDGEIRYTDDHLGELFDLLAQRGLFDETITVVTSDHGDEFFEHGRKGHAESLYDEVLRVPLVMRYPKKIAAGRVVDRQVRLMDVAPTILELAGVYRPESFGYCGDRPQACRDLSPWIQGHAEDLPSLISYGHLRNQLQSVRTENAKMIRRFGDSGRSMRFDLASDPGEHVNLFGGEERVDTLFSGLLDQWWNAAGKEGEAAEIDPGQIEVLRSLGYLK